MRSVAFEVCAASLILLLPACGGGGKGTIPTTYAISGVLSGAGGQPVALRLTGTVSATTTADSSGGYTFGGLPDGSYVVTPSLTGWTCSPTSRTVTINGGNVTGQDFTAAKVYYAISGAVSGAIADGVLITLTGSSTATVTTAGGGHYAFSGLDNGIYTLTPSMAGYTFTPASIGITVSGANVAAQGFTAAASATTHTISGKVSGVGGARVTMKLTGAGSAAAATDASGAYTLTDLANGSYRVAPYDWVCSPVSREVTLSGADAVDQDFACATVCADLPYSGFAAIPSYETVDGKAYVFGGYAYAVNNYTDTIRVFDVETSTWSTLPFRMPYPIADGGTAIYLDNHFYVTPALASGEFAGWGSHSRLIDIDLAKGAASETVAIPYGGAIWQLLSCAANGKMYIFGGHNGQDQVGIFEYVPGASSMSLVARMGYAHRNGAVTLGSDGAMYIMGQSSQIERFDPGARTVGTMRAVLPAEIVGIYGISAIWHVASENAIYFTPGGYYSSVLDPPIYKFDYVADTMTSTGLKLPGWVAGNNVYDVGFRDGANPHVAFYFQGANSTALYRLCRTRLGVP